MTTSYRTHLTVLQQWVDKTPTAAAFKVPQWSESREFGGWISVSYAEFVSDVEKAARHWHNVFTQKGLQARDTVGIWSFGLQYADVVHIWGLARAGFTPLVISRRITHMGAIALLLKAGEAKGFVYDPSIPKPELDVISLPAEDISTLNVDGLPLPELWVPSSDNDIVIKFHSSGSSSGMPKMIPMTARWIDFLFDKLGHILASDAERQETISLNGSVVHLSGTMIIYGGHSLGQCVVICKEVTSSPEEIKQLWKEHGLTRIFMFSTFLAKLLVDSRSDPELLQALKSFSQTIHGGVPMQTDLGNWARDQGIRIVDGFGSTEIGTGMTAGSEGPGPNAAYLKALPGTKYKFVSIYDTPEPEDGKERPSLVELIVAAESGDCPHLSLRNKETGDFHTGDLLEEVAPGYYLSKGRNDDWIKMKDALRCDTQSLEDNVKEVCGKDLVGAVVCIGTGRPSPVLVVEPLEEGEVASSLTQTILERITPFHERMYSHERIEDARFIIVAPKGSLPKTPKGNVQRKPVETTFEKTLDDLFGEDKI